MKRFPLRTLIAALLLVACAAAPAAALDLGGHDRDGVVLGLGLGYGWNKYEFEVPGGDPQTTGNISTFVPALSVGWARNDHFIASLTFSGWKKSFIQDITPVSARSLLFMADLAWFPAGEGFWIKGGVGAGDLDLTVTAPARIFAVKDTGVIWGLGAGYEYRASHSAAIGIAYDARWLLLDKFDEFGPTRNVNQAVSLSLRFYQ